MKKDLSQTSIDYLVQSTCDRLKRVVSTDLYKDYVITLFFLRVLGDTWERQYAKYNEQYQGDKKQISEMMRIERFQIPETARFSYLYEHRNEPDNAERLDNALCSIEDANISRLSHIFQFINFNDNKLGNDNQKNDLLCNLLEDFEGIDMSFQSDEVENLNKIGNAFNYIIQYLAANSSKNDQEFYTHPDVSILMAQLLEIQEADKICDPACGSASLLLECANQVSKNFSGSNRYALFGQEINSTIWSMAKMNMILNNQDNHQIEWGDVICNPKLLESNNKLKNFDVVVSNPPFSLSNWGYDIAKGDKFKRFGIKLPQKSNNDSKIILPPKSRGDFAFILHMLSTLENKSGRMAILIPHGVLFRGGTEAIIRQKLIEDNKLDTVIGLPEKLFYSTNISAAILIFKMNKSDDKVLFIDASNEFVPGKNQNKLSDNSIQKILSTYKERKSVDKYAYLASLNDIKDNDFNCNIPRYVNTAAEVEIIDLEVVRQEREKLMAELSGLNEKISELIKDLK